MASAKEIFLDALDHEGADRDAYVAEACAGDRDLAGRVRALLDAHTRATDVLPDEVVPPARTLAGAFRAGTTVGSYRLIRPIGEGGFGTVWIAEQEGALRRRAALKILKAERDTAEVVARFEAERRALARMEHPSIASVFEGGTTESGQPWFAMEFVDGEPITRYAEKRGLDVIGRLELLLKVCRAVQHAHQKGIIHRDLKPTNVLVAEVDGAAVPKVIDFGIAKAVDERLTDHTLRTQAGAFLGTPAYMSPEQVDGVTDVDTRSDVYSLGVLLYELLCGSPPFDEETLGGAGLFELQRLIREVEPPRPSQRLARRMAEAGSDGHAPRRATTTRLRDVRGELDWIVMRCLEKDRDRRYPSVAVLADELERHLRGEPVLAGPPDVRYRLAKLASRHRTGIATAGAILLLIVAGAVLAVALAVRATRAERDARDEALRAAEAERVARREAERARTELAKYERIAEFLQDTFHSVDPAVARGRDTSLLQLVLGRAERRVETEAGNPEVEAALRHTIGLAYFSIADFQRALPHLERAASLRDGEGHAEDDETLDVLNDLAGLYLRLGRKAEAEALIERTLEGRRALYGPDTEPTLKTLESLAVLRGHQNRLAEAAELFLTVEAGLLATRGADDLGVQRVSSNLAGVLQQLGRFEEAGERLQHALDVQLAQLGPRDPRTLKAMNNLADLYLDTDRYEEALELLLRAVELKKVVLEPGHPSVLTSLNNLALTYSRLDRPGEAEEVYREALAMARTTLGERHAMTLGLTHNLGTLIAGRGDYERAGSLLRQAWDGSRAEHGDAHPRTLSSKRAYAITLLERGRPEDALVLVEEVMSVAPRAFPPGSRFLASNWIDLGQCLRASGRVDEAVDAFERGYAIADAAGDTSERRRAVEKLAALLEDEGRAGEAARWRARLSEAE